MPAWAEAAPMTYWDAADLHERANGRLFQRVEVALPTALTAAEQRELAVGFCPPSDRWRAAALHPGDPRRRRDQPALSPAD